MRDYLARIRPRPDTEIPTEPGYCFEGGFIANEKWKNEQANVDIDIAGHPDAFVSVWILPVASRKRDKPLLDRVGGALAQLGNLANAVQVLRKGDRQIGPYKGQEYLVSAPNSGGLRAHSFTWETQGEGTLQEPSIEIKLETGRQDPKGNPQQTRLTDEQALQLWDRIVSSFRLRPVDPAPIRKSEAAPPDAPLGELAATGRTCPQTGWWESVDDDAVRTSRRRHIKAGDVMPRVTKLSRPGLLDKLRGIQPVHQGATMWTLVDYGDPPVADGKPQGSGNERHAEKT